MTIQYGYQKATDKDVYHICSKKDATHVIVDASEYDVFCSAYDSIVSEYHSIQNSSAVKVAEKAAKETADLIKSHITEAEEILSGIKSETAHYVALREALLVHNANLSALKEDES